MQTRDCARVIYGPPESCICMKESRPPLLISFHYIFKSSQQYSLLERCHTRMYAYIYILYKIQTLVVQERCVLIIKSLVGSCALNGK